MIRCCSDIPACNAFRRGFYHIRSSCCYDSTAIIASARSHIYDVIGIAYHIKIMFDYDYCGSIIYECLEYFQQAQYIQRVQSYCWLIEDKDGV